MSTSIQSDRHIYLEPGTGGGVFVKDPSDGSVVGTLATSADLSDILIEDLTLTTLTTTGAVNIGGALNHDGSTAGFFNVTPVTRPTAYTQTYATADKTHANATAAAVATTGATSTTPFGYAEAQANAIVTNLNAVIADHLDTKQLVNSVIDDLQALGLVQ